MKPPAPKPHPWGLGACLVGIALLAACATPTPGRLADDPEVVRASEGWEPLPYSILVAPAEVETPTAEPAPEVRRIPVEEGRVGEIVLGSLRQNRIFRKAMEPEQPVSSVRERLLASARERDASLVMEFTLESVECRHVGRNALWFPNLLLWLTLWVPSLWVADQTYQADAEASYELRNTEDGNLVYRGSVSASAEVDLDYIDRDVKWWGLFRTEDGDLNWKAIVNRMRPHALHALEKAFVLSLLQDLGPLARDETFRPRVFPGQSTAPEVAIVIGVSEYLAPPLQDRCQFADKDAVAFRDYLMRRKESQLEADGTAMLVGEDASREKIETAFFKLVTGKAQHRDRISVYFSGLGAAGHGADGGHEFYLLPRDADPSDLAGTAISLQRIGEWLREAKADQIVIVVDAGFGSTGFSKGAKRGSRPDEEEVAAFRKTVREMLPGAGRALLFAGVPGDEVAEERRDQQGLFTYYLLRYLGVKGDADGDGAVTLGELAAKLPQKVSREAEMLGRFQVPLVFGDESLVINRP